MASAQHSELLKAIAASDRNRVDELLTEVDDFGFDAENFREGLLSIISQELPSVEQFIIMGQVLVRVLPMFDANAFGEIGGALIRVVVRKGFDDDELLESASALLPSLLAEHIDELEFAVKTYVMLPNDSAPSVKRVLEHVICSAGLKTSQCPTVIMKVIDDRLEEVLLVHKHVVAGMELLVSLLSQQGMAMKSPQQIFSWLMGIRKELISRVEVHAPSLQLRLMAAIAMTTDVLLPRALQSSNLQIEELFHGCADVLFESISVFSTLNEDKRCSCDDLSVMWRGIVWLFLKLYVISPIVSWNRILRYVSSAKDGSQDVISRLVRTVRLHPDLSMYSADAESISKSFSRISKEEDLTLAVARYFVGGENDCFVESEEIAEGKMEIMYRNERKKQSVSEGCFIRLIQKLNRKHNRKEDNLGCKEMLDVIQSEKEGMKAIQEDFDKWKEEKYEALSCSPWRSSVVVDLERERDKTSGLHHELEDAKRNIHRLSSKVDELKKQVNENKSSQFNMRTHVTQLQSRVQRVKEAESAVKRMSEELSLWGAYYRNVEDVRDHDRKSISGHASHTRVLMEKISTTKKLEEDNRHLREKLKKLEYEKVIFERQRDDAVKELRVMRKELQGICLHCEDKLSVIQEKYEHVCGLNAILLRQLRGVQT